MQGFRIGPSTVLYQFELGPQSEKHKGGKRDIVCGSKKTKQFLH